MKKNYFLFTLLASIFVSSLVIIILPSYQVEPSSVVSNPVTTPTTIPWQTYRNEKYGFEFQYPADMGEPQVGQTPPSQLDQNSPLHISVVNSQTSIDTLVKNQLFFKDRHQVPVSLIVGGQQSRQVSFFTGEIGHIIATVPYRNVGYIIISTHYSHVQQYKKYPTNFSKILSTFKFTK